MILDLEESMQVYMLWVAFMPVCLHEVGIICTWVMRKGGLLDRSDWKLYMFFNFLNRSSHYLLCKLGFVLTLLVRIL